jgi:hypothetical protein
MDDALARPLVRTRRDLPENHTVGVFRDQISHPMAKAGSDDKSTSPMSF